MSATIYYDGACPFCAGYTSLLRLREALGAVSLVDVRTDPNARQRLLSEGFDLDQGMVLEMDGKSYWGADAVHRLGLLSTCANWFNRINAKVFSNAKAAAVLYPLMRGGRNAFLFSRGHQRIQRDPSSDMSVFAIFAHAFGMYAVADFLYSLYLNTQSSASYAAGAAGLYLIARPRSPRVFVLLCAVLLAATIAAMPTHSNHAILATFTLVSAAAAALASGLSGKSWGQFMATFAPLGRALLLTMYFFGVFHKINTGFLDPEMTCAAVFWKQMPWPLSLIDSLSWRYAMIYGTLLGEGAIFFGLLFHRTRYAAIVLGIAFHTMISLSDYGLLLAFTTLTISLHLLFLSPGAAARITSAPAWRVLQGRLHTRMGVLALLCGAAIFTALANLGNFNSISLLWLAWPAWLIYLIGRYGRERTSESTVGPPVYTRTWVLNALSLFFVFNCFSPYLGLKNAQAMNMFANLTYEDGRSNHLLLPGTWPFGYGRDSVKLQAVNGRPFDGGWGNVVPYYFVLNWADTKPGTKFTFIRKGRQTTDATNVTLAADIQGLHPRWFRAWFHFRPFPATGDQRCEPGLK